MYRWQPPRRVPLQGFRTAPAYEFRSSISRFHPRCIDKCGKRGNNRFLQSSLHKLNVKGGTMNTQEVRPIASEREPNNQSQDDLLNEVGGVPLKDSGFETEIPDKDFDERS